MIEIILKETKPVKYEEETVVYTLEKIKEIFGDSPCLVTELVKALEKSEAEVERLKKMLRELSDAANNVDKKLAEYGGKIVPHLMDNDENDGQRMREMILEVKNSI